MSLSLQYLIREPKTIKDKNPLLILLHGYGSNEEDLFSFASELPEDCYVVSARAPHDMMYDSYAWYAINFTADATKFSDIPQAIESRELIANFIDELTSKYPIDQDKTVLIGFSQGAILSYAVALSYPKKVNKIVALSGYLNEEIVVDTFLDNPDIQNVKVFASHGSVDQVIPVEWARISSAKIKDFGIDIVYKEYPVGHGVAPQNFFDFKKWIETYL